ncbi:unnamed protein product [Mytilus coruscus]|uniref:Uncharacterized protein n=1 Tax=Mytilus coruscus TaxID=42192 RepID=A0A6J8A1Q5_MYTCO|nr:unnamed protein product [Mytilus coruscus]
MMIVMTIVEGFCVINLIFLISVDCQCSFPSDLIGNWLGADRGGITFYNSSFMTSYDLLPHDALPESLDFTCFYHQDNKYILRSTTKLLFANSTINLFLCIELTMVDSYIAYYYQLTEYSPYLTNILYGTVNVNVNLQDVCTRKTVARNFITLVRNGSIEEQNINITCSSAIQAIFTNVTIQHHGEASGFHCSDTTWDVCTDKTRIHISYSGVCDNTAVGKTFSSGGMYKCIHSIDEDSETYLSVWNMDVGIQNPFSCFSLQRIGNTTYATETSKFCSNTSSSTITEPGGISLVLTDPSEVCEDITIVTTTVGNDEAPYLTGLYGLIVIPVIIIVIGIGAIQYRLHKDKTSQSHTDFDPFSSSTTIHIEVVSKATFDPSIIHSARKYNFKPKKSANSRWPIFDPHWSPKNILTLNPAPKVAPLYSDVFDD